MTTLWTPGDSLEHFNQHFDEELASDEQKSGIARDLFRAGGKATQAFPNKEDAGWWRANGPGMVDNWVGFRNSLPNWVIWTTPAGEPAIELQLNASILGVPVKAYLDRVFVDVNTGELNIVDLKTGSRAPDSGLQLGFYKVLLQKTLDVEATTGYYWMARKGSLTSGTDLTKYSESLIGTMLQDFNRAVDSGIFIPRSSSFCGTCSVNRACALYGGAEAHLYDPLHPDYRPDIKEAK